MSNQTLEQEINDRFYKEFGGASRKTAKVTKEEPKEEQFKTTQAVPSKGDILFSHIWGKVPPSGVDHILTDIYSTPTFWDEDIRKFIPSKNPHYVWQWQQLEDLVVALLINDKAWISGPRGSGKSSLVEQTCAMLNWPFIRMNGKGDMDSAGVFGSVKVRPNNGVPETVWVDGPVTTAVKRGAVLLFDEPTVVPPEISMGLQWLLEDDGKLMLTDKPGDLEEQLLTPNNMFRLVCADNTRGRGDSTGDYAGTGTWNTATLDRFGTTIHLPYLDDEHQEKILSNRFPSISPSLIKNMITLAGRIQTAYTSGSISFSMSPRTLISWANKANLFHDTKKGFTMAYFEKLDEDVERKEVENLFFAVFGEYLNRS
jgi:cobaltochelatase CobS